MLAIFQNRQTDGGMDPVSAGMLTVFKKQQGGMPAIFQIRKADSGVGPIPVGMLTLLAVCELSKSQSGLRSGPSIIRTDIFLLKAAWRNARDL